MDREEGKAAQSPPNLGAIPANLGPGCHWCAATEFLGQVPLLQCLPGSSIRRIAEAVQNLVIMSFVKVNLLMAFTLYWMVRKYATITSTLRSTKMGEGTEADAILSSDTFCYLNNILIVLKAEVSAPANTEEANRPDYVLNKYDYFGYGANSSVHQVNVVTLSKLTCFILPNQYGHLLQPKTIWNAEETPETHSLLEQILHLEPLEIDIFRGFTLPGAPTFRQVYGGQLIGQALAAASKTVDCLKMVHSLHAIFLVAGDNNLPIIYQVHRARDGSSFATRKVEAKQKGLVIFTLIASFQKEELGFEHQAATMPDVPPPEQLLNMEEIRERHLTDPRFPTQYRNLAAKKKFVPWPIEMRFCEGSASQHKPSLNFWFRARGKLSDDQALHRCVVAYASDLLYSGVSLNPHRQKGLKTYSLSLDHSIWFHKPVKADDWLLYVIESPSAHGGRGFVTGRMFNRQGELVMSLTQEALIRKEKTRVPNPRPKL
ncbi:acyl-CoA hydrolase 2-like isoform X2 [Phragmites australis]|uniref:acyl-CoA hydrolase 2-like isoform X2 n=1 Tax=Phragmites australis TaxID=29695 RepID=UPI002D78B5E1|nr:acyl-CoA hydrolase 2-like isoform X2 [Phragmites australis]